MALGDENLWKGASFGASLGGANMPSGAHETPPQDYHVTYLCVSDTSCPQRCLEHASKKNKTKRWRHKLFNLLFLTKKHCHFFFHAKTQASIFLKLVPVLIFFEYHVKYLCVADISCPQALLTACITKKLTTTKWHTLRATLCRSR